MVLTCWKRKVGTMVAPQLCEERAAEGHTRPWSGCRQQGSRTKAKQGNHLPGFPPNTEVLTPDNHPKHPQGSARYTQRQKKGERAKFPWVFYHYQAVPQQETAENKTLKSAQAVTPPTFLPLMTGEKIEESRFNRILLQNPMRNTYCWGLFSINTRGKPKQTLNQSLMLTKFLPNQFLSVPTEQSFVPLTDRSFRNIPEESNHINCDFTLFSCNLGTIWSIIEPVL